MGRSALRQKKINPGKSYTYRFDIFFQTVSRADYNIWVATGPDMATVLSQDDSVLDLPDEGRWDDL
jgi:hypothetical protein